MGLPGPQHDPEDWPLPLSRRESTLSSSTQSSGQISPGTSPFTSHPLSRTASSVGSRSREASCYSLHEEVIHIPLNNHVTITFVRSNKLFKLRYTYIDVRKDTTGSLRCLELGGGPGQQTPLIHTCPFPSVTYRLQTGLPFLLILVNESKIPVPHLEHPKRPNEPSLRISFMEEQTVQSVQTVFTTQLSYQFEEERDCVQFQEIILASKLVFLAGIAEAKSKGRGEECISQNLRILRGPHGKQVMLFFANSQRKDLKRYVKVPVNCIESCNPGKKPGRPVVIQLQPNFDILTQMKTLQIQFLDDTDRIAFCQFLSDHIK